jgi:hypothetical protein
MKNPGRIVETSHGRGRTRNSDQLMNGRCTIYLANPDGTPKLDAQGRQMIVREECRKLKIVGFVD